MNTRRTLLRGFWEFVGNARRQARRFPGAPRLAIDYARFRRAIGRRDWMVVRAMLPTLAEAALQEKDFRILLELGAAAMRLNEPQLAVDLTYAGRLHKGLSQPTDWNGENISDATLAVRLMEGRERNIADAMPLVGHIRAVAQRAERTVIVGDHRMRPLLQRTLPEVTFCDVDASIDLRKQDKLVTAGLNDLQRILGYDSATIERLHVPFVADPEQVNSMRERYRSGRNIPLIGICWESPQFGKDSAPLALWTELLRGVPAQYVSLQRGDPNRQVSQLCDGDIGRIIVDRSVDQMADVDAFASQLASLDLIVTMSNTGAHLVGALGKKMILVRDDIFRVAWPYLSDQVPWYPEVTVVGKDGRSWAQTFDDVIAKTRTAIEALPK